MDPIQKYQMSIQGVEGRCAIYFEERLGNVMQYLPSKVIILTDQNVHRIYGKDFPSHPVIIVKPGEVSKSLETLQTVFDQLIEHQTDRSYFILGVGGGVVCDLTGFAASTYMRGLPFGFVATTLLSQVDASLGGKNGINVSGVKNLMGVFTQPRFVLCDLDLLKTLPPEEIRSGLGELIKTALIQDATLFSDLEDQGNALFELKPELMRDLVWRSVTVKKRIVETDERETGKRRLLNFGHTFGHPIEMVHGITHGEAVCIGILIANYIAVKEGLLDEAEAVRIQKFLADLDLVKKVELKKKDIISALRKDKKRKEEHIHFVLLKSIGDARFWECKLKQLDEYLMSYPGVGT